ncbi:hypothetical protein K491DRAFT_122810 [Lophiostoma macrostomum CBS 122681]|uniref:Uncharacterized protein n=1 Tax=Lophiostoma macrostomum CBS 122681 TaxID=1314788 RepID=A0A6A6TLY4_9PLEO|nr:hypothetical protein K491DRAFT_122810 [Lophiostoma macrostomum CBS 122681]
MSKSRRERETRTRIRRRYAGLLAMHFGGRSAHSTQVVTSQLQTKLNIESMTAAKGKVIRLKSEKLGLLSRQRCRKASRFCRESREAPLE